MGCRLLVAIDFIDRDFVGNLEEHLISLDKSCDLHLLLRSPGGDGEQAIRAVRSLQARCAKLSIIVPDIAKSAATLLALGADEIRVGPTSDMGPVDPQMNVGNHWTSAKSILSAIEQAEEAIARDRSLTPLWASLLAEVSAVAAQDAKAEMLRTESMIRQAISYRSEPPRDDESDALVAALVQELQEKPTSHGHSLGEAELIAMGLPVKAIDPSSWEWETIWRLWMLYWGQVGDAIYESAYNSYRPFVPPPA